MLFNTKKNENIGKKSILDLDSHKTFKISYLDGRLFNFEIVKLLKSTVVKSLWITIWFSFSKNPRIETNQVLLHIQLFCHRPSWPLIFVITVSRRPSLIPLCSTECNFPPSQNIKIIRSSQLEVKAIRWLGLQSNHSSVPFHNNSVRL